MSSETLNDGVGHWADCSIYEVNPETGDRCDVCDCGALRMAISSERAQEDAVIASWCRHKAAIYKSTGGLRQSLP